VVAMKRRFALLACLLLPVFFLPSLSFCHLRLHAELDRNYASKLCSFEASELNQFRG